jgi:hypothetical protein
MRRQLVAAYRGTPHSGLAPSREHIARLCRRGAAVRQPSRRIEELAHVEAGIGAGARRSVSRHVNTSAIGRRTPIGSRDGPSDGFPHDVPEFAFRPPVFRDEAPFGRPCSHHIERPLPPCLPGGEPNDPQPRFARRPRRGCQTRGAPHGGEPVLQAPLRLRARFPLGTRRARAARREARATRGCSRAGSQWSSVRRRSARGSAERAWRWRGNRRLRRASLLRQ